MSSQISILVAFAKADTTNTHKEINFAKVYNSQAQKICADTGVVVKGALKILTAHGIRHAFAGHGNDKMEKERGSIGLKDADFELIPEILNNSDKVINGNKGRKGQESIVVVKLMGQKEYNVVMSVRGSNNGIGLIFNTMFIQNKKPMFPPA